MPRYSAISSTDSQRFSSISWRTPRPNTLQLPGQGSAKPPGIHHSCPIHPKRFCQAQSEYQLARHDATRTACSDMISPTSVVPQQGSMARTVKGYPPLSLLVTCRYNLPRFVSAYSNGARWSPIASLATRDEKSSSIGGNEEGHVEGRPNGRLQVFRQRPGEPGAAGSHQLKAGSEQENILERGNAGSVCPKLQ